MPAHRPVRGGECALFQVINRSKRRFAPPCVYRARTKSQDLSPGPPTTATAFPGRRATRNMIVATSWPADNDPTPRQRFIDAGDPTARLARILPQVPESEIFDCY
jgi:hypothetical protein